MATLSEKKQLPSSSKIKRVVVASRKGQVHIIYGSDPSKRAPFEAAAHYLHKRLSLIYKSTSVTVNKPVNIESAGEMMQFLLKKRECDSKKIIELHIFLHSWSTGLSLNYGATSDDGDSKSLRKIYGPLVDLYHGSDDAKQFNPLQLRAANFFYLSKDQVKKLRASFATGALARLWGCNTAFGASGSRDPYATITNTIAQFANITAYGTPASTQFYAYIKGKWTTKHQPVGTTAPWPFELRAFKRPKSKQIVKVEPTIGLKSLKQLKLVELKPDLEYLDDMLDKAKQDQTNPELYRLNPDTMYLFVFDKIPRINKIVKIHQITKASFSLKDLIILQPHSEWKYSSDGLSIELGPQRNEFMAKFHKSSALSNAGLLNKEFYLEISYKIEGQNKIHKFDKKRFIVK